MKLKTFGDNTEAENINKHMEKELNLSKNLFEILNTKLTIPSVAKSPAKYNTPRWTPNNLNNNALKR